MSKKTKSKEVNQLKQLLSLYKASLEIIVSKRYTLQESHTIDKLSGLLHAQITQLESDIDDGKTTEV